MQTLVINELWMYYRQAKGNGLKVTMTLDPDKYALDDGATTLAKAFNPRTKRTVYLVRRGGWRKGQEQQ